MKAGRKNNLSDLLKAYKTVEDIAKKKDVEYITANFKNKRLPKLIFRFNWKHKKSRLYCKKLK